MKIIGIAGGIASGKSLVAGCLRDLGAVIVDADRIGHEVLSEPDVIDKIRAQWGATVFDHHGEVDRKALAQIVFADPPAGPIELKRLEAITHPQISQRLQEQLVQYERQGTPAVVIDAPVMFKAGWDKICDDIVFVESTADIRLQRALERGWNSSQFERREASQLPISEKKARSNWIVENSAELDKTIRQVEQIWQKIVTPMPDRGVN